MNSLCEKCKLPDFELGDNGKSLAYFTWKSIREDKIVKGEKKTFKITKKSSDFPEHEVIEGKNNVPNALVAIPGIMDITKIYWQRGIDVLIESYRYEHLHKENYRSFLVFVT